MRKKHPNWKLQENDKDEFPTWSESWWGPRTEYTIEQLCELENEEIVQVFQQQEKHELEDLLYQWRLAVQKCNDKAISFIGFLADRKIWNPEIWHATIGGFRSADRKFSIWDRLNKLLSTIPDNLNKQIVSSLTYWLREQTKELPPEKEASFWTLWDTLLPHVVSKDVGELKDIVTSALNHPAGYLAEALLDRLWARNPEKNQLLPDFFTKRAYLLIAGKTDAHLLGKVIFASRLINLFLVDPAWTSQNLIPLFDWKSPSTAKAVWQGYLWAPKITPDLMDVMKGYFLEALRKNGLPGGSAKRLFQLFTYICLDYPTTMTNKEMRETLKFVGNEGRFEIVETIYRYLEQAGEKSSFLWDNRVGPWINKVYNGPQFSNQ